MKNLFILFVILDICYSLNAQSYPDPEHPNEVYALQNDSNALIRLEREISTLDVNTKMKKGSVESSYSIDKERSTVRITHFTFVFREDSETSFIPGFTESDSTPSFHSISLYKMASSKGKRKIVMMNMSNQKSDQAEPLDLNFRKVRERYFEFIVDKPLQKGEYAFVIKRYDTFTNQAMILAFGVD